MDLKDKDRRHHRQTLEVGTYRIQTVKVGRAVKFVTGACEELPGEELRQNYICSRLHIDDGRL